MIVPLGPAECFITGEHVVIRMALLARGLFQRAESPEGRKRYVSASHCPLQEFESRIRTPQPQLLH